MNKNTIILISVLIICFLIYKKEFNEIDNEYIKINNEISTKYNDLNKNNYGYGVSSSNEIAVNVGMSILDKGGNAVDAAIAISYVLGVVEPYASGIGGGGGMLIYSPNNESIDFYNYRETAPIKSSGKASDVGVPGFVKGMEVVHKDYGTFDLKHLIEPAIYYAEKGFKINKILSDRIYKSRYRLENSKIQHFYKNNQFLDSGDILVQKELANTLRLIQNQGSYIFYNGIISKCINNTTTITAKDLNKYEVIKQQPVYGEYNGYEIISAPPPFSGITLIQILKLYELSSSSYTNKKSYIDDMKKIVDIAYKDRLGNIADSMFYKKNYDKLTTNEYIEYLYEKNFNIVKDKYEEEHESTTHFVVMDKDGMLVSCTNTLGNFWGSGIYIEGFFMNDNMKNFSKSNNSPNSYEQGKRPRTFTSPTIIKNEESIMAIGSPGGNRIPQILAQVIIDNIKFKSNIQDAIDAPRIIFESDNQIKMEESSKFKYNMYFGSVHAIGFNSKMGIYGGTDKRRDGKISIKYNK